MKKIFYIKKLLLLFISKSSILVGGQAVIEGVMMRVPGFYATAVRNPKGEIEVKRNEFIPLTEKKSFLNFPILRGGIHLFESIKIGTKTLQWSADIAMPEEEKSNKIIDTLMNIMAIIFAISIFFAIPYLITNYFSDKYNSEFIFNLFAGIIRITFFIIYLLLISRMKDVKNLFQYHGAEHKTVYTFEAGKTLDVKETYNFPTQHPRCGTSFMFIVMMVAIITYAIIDSVYVDLIGNLNIITRILLHLMFIPIVSGLGYEILKIIAKYNKNIFFKVLSIPGIWLQYITTKEPSDKQIEVAICALKSAFGDTLSKHIGKKYTAEAIS